MRSYLASTVRLAVAGVCGGGKQEQSSIGSTESQTGGCLSAWLSLVLSPDFSPIQIVNLSAGVL